MAINRLLYTIYSGNPFTGTLVNEKCVKEYYGAYYVGVDSGNIYSTSSFKEIAYAEARIGQIASASDFNNVVTQQYQNSKLPYQNCRVSIVPYDKIGNNRLFRCLENNKIFHEIEIEILQIPPVDIE